MQVAEKIWVVEDLFTKDESNEWVEYAEGLGFGDAPISVGVGKEVVRKDIRNNNRAMVDDVDKTFLLWQDVKEHLPKMIYHRVAVGLNERLRFYRYDSGQQFNLHTDGSFRRDNGELSLLTLMVYLNEDFEGGETAFYNLEKTIIKPKTGMLLAFEHQLLHEGSIVTSGRKYVLRTDVMFSP